MCVRSLRTEGSHEHHDVAGLSPVSRYARIHSARGGGNVDGGGRAQGRRMRYSYMLGRWQVVAHFRQRWAVSNLISRHHAQKSKASGFCYVADCILAILSLKRPVPSVPMRRPRVMYLDLDLHFSDAVSQAFYNASSTASSQILVHCFLRFSRAFITAFRRCLSIIHPQVFSLPLRSRAYPTLTTPRSIHSPCQYP